jgi:hypothetical protein
MRLLLLLPVLATAASGCLAVSHIDHVATTTPTPPDRTDCGEILGSAFRSEAEQAWFRDNCSKWADGTLGLIENVQQQPFSETQTDESRTAEQPTTQAHPTGTAIAIETPTPPPQPTSTVQFADDAQRCDAIRGQPNVSAVDRDWYLAQCRGTSTPTATPTYDCNQIRGRPYTSAEEREWYLANCASQQQAAQAEAPVGPEGRPCAAIYSTRFRSAGERAWFYQNCY